MRTHTLLVTRGRLVHAHTRGDRVANSQYLYRDLSIFLKCLNYLSTLINKMSFKTILAGLFAVTRG